MFHFFIGLGGPIGTRGYVYEWVGPDMTLMAQDWMTLIEISSA